MALGIMGGANLAAANEDQGIDPRLTLSAAKTAIEPAMGPPLTLDRVFASPDLAGEQPRALKLSPDGRWVTALRPRVDERDRYDLWALDPATGQWRMLLDSTRFGGGPLSEAERMQRERARIGDKQGIITYQWSKDGRSILVPLDGDLYLAGLDGQVTRLTTSAAGELNPEISPLGRYASFVRDRNLVVLDLARRREVKVTGDGGATVTWGEAEFVAQEEMDRHQGYWWSPTEARLAVARVDEKDVAIVSRAAIGAGGTKVFDQRYPLAGTANARVDLWLMNPDGQAAVKVDLGPDPDIYVARVDWAPDGSALYVQRQTRDQTRVDLLRVDPATGQSQPVLAEIMPRWVNLSDNYRFLKDGRILWWSERDGHGHLYLYTPQAPAKARWRQLTQGPWEVAALIGVDETRQRLTFTANRDDVLARQVYTLDYDGPSGASRGQPRRITASSFWHDAEMDDAASRLIVRRSGTDTPSQTYLADADGRLLAWITENAVAGDHPYAPYRASHVATRFGTVKAADGSRLHWSMLVPDLEPGRRYPVFFSHYGGPGAQMVTRAWGGALNQYLVDQGYIVFMLDNRGSANRGRAFGDQIWHGFGTVEVEDQLAGLAFLKQQDFVDPARIATYGWSYGGYLTIRLFEKAPGAFAAGIAGAPVTQWGLYDTHYTERYLGDPRRDPAIYERADLVADVGAIRDPLLLIHGMADDNVVFDHSTLFMAAMQKAARPFETMVYPGQTHRVSGPGVSVHLWQTMLDFLDRRMGAPGRADRQ